MLAGVTLHNFLVIGLMACVFIVLFKAVAARTPVQGLKSFAGAV
jgi:F0F1-type ATP synthase assembly protein I